MAGCWSDCTDTNACLKITHTVFTCKWRGDGEPTDATCRHADEGRGNAFMSLSLSHTHTHTHTQVSLTCQHVWLSFTADCALQESRQTAHQSCLWCCSTLERVCAARSCPTMFVCDYVTVSSVPGVLIDAQIFLLSHTLIRMINLACR